MIELVVASALYTMSWQTAAATSARQQLVQCLKEASTKAQSDKLAADGFAAFAQQSCATQASGLKSAIWSFDSKNKVSRKQSEADVDLQIEDYVATAEERYRMSTTPKAQAQQASQPTQPQQ